MVPTVGEEKSPLLGAQNMRPTTIEMAEATGAEDDGVLGRDHPRALRARRGLRFRHRSTSRYNGRMSRTPLGLTPACVTPGAPMVGRLEDNTERALTLIARSVVGRLRRWRRLLLRTWPSHLCYLQPACTLACRVDASGRRDPGESGICSRPIATGRPTMDQESLRLLIQRKIRDGRLPHDGIKKVWSNRSDRERCDG